MNRRKYVEIGDEKRVARPRRGCLYISKIILQVISVLASAAVLGLEAYLYTDWKEFYGQDANNKVAYFLSGPAGAVIIWNLVEFITLCARGGRGIHPGAHVAVDLILFLACGVIGALCLIGAKKDQDLVSNLQTYVNSYYDAGKFDDQNWSEYSQGDVDVLGKYVDRTQIAGGILALVAVLTFILFVFACVETHRRRKASRRRSRAPIIVTSSYEQTRAEAAAEMNVPLTGINMPRPYDPVTQGPAGQAYYDRA